MFEEEELKLTDRPKEYFEWLKNHKNFPVDRYDIFMNKMKANGFKTLDINNRSGIRVINEENNKMVDYYYRRKRNDYKRNSTQDLQLLPTNRGNRQAKERNA